MVFRAYFALRKAAKSRLSGEQIFPSTQDGEVLENVLEVYSEVHKWGCMKITPTYYTSNNVLRRVTRKFRTIIVVILTKQESLLSRENFVFAD